MLDEAVKEQIESLVKNNDVMLFMKGNPQFPQCGFSASVVEVLNEYLDGYETFNVLADPNIRSGIKEYADWPTIPQLYIKGEFVGGADIIKQMHAGDELGPALGAKKIEVGPPGLTISESAAKAFLDAQAGEEHKTLRLQVSGRFEYGLSFGPGHDGDIEETVSGLTVLMDRGTARRAVGMSIDFVTGPEGSGFKIENPNEPPKVQNISVAELAARREKGELSDVYDVRPDAERALAKLDFATQLTDEIAQKIQAMSKDTPLVFHCHHGGRSMNAAEYFIQQGFTDVYNLAGGIDAWSTTVDDSVPRY